MTAPSWPQRWMPSSTAARFPVSNSPEMFGLKARVKVHILPGWFEPVAVCVSGLVVFNQEIIDRFMIFGMVIIMNSDSHGSFNRRQTGKRFNHEAHHGNASGKYSSRGSEVWLSGVYLNSQRLVFLSKRIWQMEWPWAIVFPRVNLKSGNWPAIPRSPSMAISHRCSISSGDAPSFSQAATSGQ